MSAFAGKYKFVSNENLDEYMEKMGAPWIARQMAATAQPKMEVTVNGDHFKFKMVLPIMTRVTEFTLDEEFEEDGWGPDAKTKTIPVSLLLLP